MNNQAHFLAGAVLALFAATAVSAPPPNDKFVNRIALFGTNITTTGTTLSASKENGEPAHAGNAGTGSVWWSWTAPAAGEVVLRTDGSTFDTLLAVYTGSAVNALTLVAANDDHGVLDTSRVKFGVQNGIQYQIAVDGFNDGVADESGEVQLALAFASAPLNRPPNDDFANATEIPVIPVTLTNSNAAASREVGEPEHAGRMGDTSIWWRWTASTAGTYRLTTAGSDFDTLLGVYTGTSVDALSEVASNDDVDFENQVFTSELTLNAMPGTLYHLGVDGFDGASGTVVLHITPVSIRLQEPAFVPGDGLQMTLLSLPGQICSIRATSDWLSWTQVARVTNITGTTVFTDSSATNIPLRFYQAEAVP